MSGEPRQRKLGSTDADGNWQLGSPTAANGEKTQTVTGYKRRAPTAATDDAPSMLATCRRRFGTTPPRRRKRTRPWKPSLRMRASSPCQKRRRSRLLLPS
jgi:hypothetical protein